MSLFGFFGLRGECGVLRGYAANGEENAAFCGVMPRTGEECCVLGIYAANGENMPRSDGLLCLEERHSPKLKLVYIFGQHNCSVDSLKC